ncbi:serine hydrolase domain-containing protein [Novosphingobium aquiterrae]|uniref:Serine hydrolase domain-containing protein n=1 Tax=Novosphingobium aquiterrae TaxID=624388 RepID=A0ABV6PKZ5_9SPHN
MTLRAILSVPAMLAAATGAAAQPAAPPPPAAAKAPPVSAEAKAKIERSRQGGERFAAFMASSRETAKAAGFSGEFGMAYMSQRTAAPATPALAVAAQNADGTSRKANGLWRWASVTKQVVAVLVLQEVQAGKMALDQPITRYLPDFAAPNAAKITVRQLLRHQSGLPNPDDSMPGPDGVPSFYQTAAGEPLAYCAGPPKGNPGGKWDYNNCDYIVAGALLEKVTGKTWQKLVADRIAVPLALSTLAAYPTGLPTQSGVNEGKPEAPRDLARYGAAASLFGSMSDMLKFDLALANGKLLDRQRRAQLWDGQADLGFIALGQWVFEAPLKGCAAPVRVVERRGAIGGVQVRNFILPDQEVAVALFSDNGDFDFGEIWQGKGLSYDMLSLAACPQESK